MMTDENSQKPSGAYYDPQKLLKVVARPTRPFFSGGSAASSVPRRRVDNDEESTEDILDKLLKKSQEEERAAVCGLDIGRISACTEAVEAACPLRGADICPRRQKRRAAELKLSLRKESARRGVPERVLVKAWDAVPRPTRAFLAVQNFLAGEQSLLVLSGANQCGKTTAAGWAAACHHQFGGSGRRTRYLTAGEATQPDRSDELQNQLPQLDLVVLDDVGQAFFGGSGFSLRQLEVLVDAVYRGNGRLIICTDIRLKGKDGDMPFFDLVGKRITSRILQSGRMEADLGPAFDARGQS